MSPATALLLHGFTSGPASMWRFREWLAGLECQVEAKAQLGHGGRGPAADYSLAALAADNLAMGDHDLVIGHSMGGATATLAAARRPEWAGRLVLVDPAWRFPTAEEAAAEKQEELAALDRDASEIRAAYSAWDERDSAAKIQEAARVWRPAVEGIIDANLDVDLRDAARSLAVPTLVICGDPAAGGAVTHADGDAVASANPNVRLVRIAGAGHNPHRDDPEAVWQALAGWLAARLPRLPHGLPLSEADYAPVTCSSLSRRRSERLMVGESACRPGSVRRALARPTVIHLGLPLPAVSCGLPAGIGRAALKRSRRPASCGAGPLDLAPGGVYLAASVT